MLMRCLRDADYGCPWDCSQTYQSIVPYTLEEVYEVVDTIERADYPHLKEELGDLLFQVIFYAQLASEDMLFDFDDIVHALVAKLVKRHPHVFPDGTLQSFGRGQGNVTEQDIRQNWENSKQRERDEKGKLGQFADIPASFPALKRAQKLQKRAADIGFDWTHLSGVFDKLLEEYNELREAVNEGEKTAIEDELGDLIFTCVNLARHLGIDAETALRRSSHKFESRFNRMETAMTAEGRRIDLLDEAAREHYWQQAKQQ